MQCSLIVITKRTKSNNYKAYKYTNNKTCMCYQFTNINLMFKSILSADGNYQLDKPCFPNTNF